MPWLLYICIFFSDFMCFDISLLLLTVTQRGVSNKHCLLPFFHFLKTIDCGYSLEPLHVSIFIEYPQSMFEEKIRKIMYTPVNTKFYNHIACNLYHVCIEIRQ